MVASRETKSRKRTKQTVRSLAQKTPRGAETRGTRDYKNDFRMQSHQRKQENETRTWKQRVKDLKDQIGFVRLSITQRKSDSRPGLGLVIKFPGENTITKLKTKAKLGEWGKAFNELLDLLEARGVELPDEYRREDQDSRPQVISHEWSISKAVDELLKNYRRRIREGTDYKESSYSDPLSRAIAIKAFEESWKSIEVLGTKLSIDWYRHYIKFRRGDGVADSTITKELRFLDRVKRFAKTEEKFDGDPGVEFWRRVFTPVKGSRNRTLTWDEYQQLLGVLTPKWQIVLTFSVYTSAEKAVCQRILTKDVRLHEGRVRLEGTKYRQTTKSAGKKLYRERYVHLTDDMFSVMEDVLKRREAVLRAEGMDPGEERLFPYFRDTGFASALRKACEDLGWVTEAQRFKHHDARHVFGTWRLLAGHDSLKTSFELGESPGSKMLREVYSEVTSAHMFPPADKCPLKHGYEWKVLRVSRGEDGAGDNGGLGHFWDTVEGPVRVGESAQVLENVARG